MGIDFREKSIIYSDSLNLEKALGLKKQCEAIGIKGKQKIVSISPYWIYHVASFGIGTFFTNDFNTASDGGKGKSKALNMVIKIASVNSVPCVKISDDLMKVSDYISELVVLIATSWFQNTGDPATIRKVKEIFDLPIWAININIDVTLNVDYGLKANAITIKLRGPRCSVWCSTKLYSDGVDASVQ